MLLSLLPGTLGARWSAALLQRWRAVLVLGLRRVKVSSALAGRQFFSTKVVATFVAIRFEVNHVPVRIDDTLYEMARAQAHAERRTIAGQIEFWALSA
ncbi:MAG TPA: hypothetical protein VMV78_16265 [Thiobacillus sp.]|nr:hypothetical protein [Thiobacillus sp.]